MREGMIYLRKFEWVSRVKHNVDDISLPKRTTFGSAGYDFFSPEDIIIPSHLKEWDKLVYSSIQEGWRVGRSHPQPFLIKLGVKVYMNSNELLEVYLRSSSPARLGLVMANSVGIIDSDYCDNETNEGEIGLLVYNITNHDVVIKKGDRVGQGIFKHFLLVDSESSTLNTTFSDAYVRIGGYGSTTGGSYERGPRLP